MGKPYSLDIRERIVACALAGHSARAAARVFGVSPSTAIRLVSEHRRGGNIAPKRQGRAPGTVGKLAPHVDFLIEVVQCEPDITLHELADSLEDACGVHVQLSSIHRALVRTGYSYKKKGCWHRSVTVRTSGRQDVCGSTSASRACVPNRIGWCSLMRHRLKPT